ncbi:choice-of-anchor J domain-containing protein [Flavobacterium sp. 20NA77.7]|uniref:Choice-of-anchor J domain-containing protein n=1 Tax=Flavobacterium nakdongensis TaxID=3073563 RepID=A0ABY9RC60_9FLAO|nr:choice-of-anchor J domain-containing protein [Flavobacterium sp. 20NA77.7]WMW77787.1 choice-of-anchor J domain-containing protein [Flavobacterium sp. 20NA77.7]
MQRVVSINKINVDFKTTNFKATLLMFIIFNLFSNFAFSQLALQTFDSGIPSSWSINSNQTVANNWVATSATGGYLGTPGAVVNPALNNTIGTTAEYFMITPQFLTPQSTEIRFHTKQGSFTNKGSIYELRLSTANQPDLNSFNVVLQTWTEAQLNVSATTYEEKIVTVPLPAGVPVYLAFVAKTNQTGTTNTSGDSWFVDNVRVIESCAPITGINSTMTATGGVINWTHPSANNFEIQIVPQGAGISASGTPVNGLSYTASGLNNGTNYDVYIRTICDGTTASTWAGPFHVQTSLLGLNCGTPIIIPSNVSTTPYVLSSNLANYYSLTDYTPYTTVGSNCFPSGTSNQLLGNHIFFNYTPTTTGLIEITQAVSVISGGGPNACYNGSSSVMVYNSCADIGVNCLAAIKTGTSSNESLTSQISNFYVQAGQTYVIVMSSPYQHTATSNASICFTFTVSGSNCPAPSPNNTTYNNLTQTSANFTWGNVGNLVSSWQYVALPVSSGVPNSSTPLLSTNTNSNNLVSSLLPNTAYNLFVRSVCNGVPGSWSAAVPFTTLCNPFTPPYYSGFTNNSETDCWSQLNLNNDLNFFTFGNNAFSEPVAKIRVTNSNDMLISPQFHLDGVTQKRLRFKYNIYGNWGLIVNNPTGGPGSFEIRMSTTGVGVNNFTTILVPLAEYTTAYNFIEMVVPLPNIVGDINIAWVLPAGATQTGTWTYFDDVYIENLPACSEPSYPIVTPGSITTTSATISWTNGYNNTQWELVAQPLGTGIPTTPGIIVSTNPYTLTNLNPSTRYEFYMRAVCSTTLQSAWTGPIFFNTLCIAQPTPYYESLNDTDVNTKKFCWSVNNVDGGITQWRIEANEASIRAASTMSQPFTSFDDWLISAPINANGLKRLRFSCRAVNGIFNPTPRGNIEVLMSSTQNFSSYTVLIPSFDFVNLAYEEKSVLFTGTGTTYIAFRVPPTMTDPGNSGIMMIDDIYVEDAPPCPNPVNLLVNSVTSSTANLSWTAGYTETQWEVIIQTAGGGIPSGTGTLVTNTPTYNATGLTQDTHYEYYVRAICGSNGNSEWIGPLSFKTACNPLSTPFLETFNSNSNTESCWTIVNGNGDSNEWNLNQTVNPIFGDQMAALFTGSNGNNNDWLISPTVTVNPNQRLRFYYKVYDSDFEEDLKVMLSTNGVSTNQFTTILYENSLNSFTNTTGVIAGSNTITLASAEDAARVRIGDFIYIPGFPFPYPTYVANVQGNIITMTTTATLTQTGVQNVQFEHVAINNEEYKEMVINLTGITSPTNINIAFHTPYFPPNPWAYRGQFTFIDNVIIEDIPSCPSVINVTSTNILDTAVTLNWESAGTETSWEISVQPYGTPAPNGNTLPQYLTTTSSHPKTITGLTPATKYQFYVRAICSGTSQSTWVGPFEFKTKCDLSNVCQYTITTISGNTGQVTQSVNVMQNGVVTQELEFPGFGQTTIDYPVFLCTGVAFDLYWDGLGSGVQYSQAQIIIKDSNNNIVWTSPLGLGTVNTTIYSGFASCGSITCPQPTNLVVNNQGVLSWSPGGSETQWEVFIQPAGNGTLPQSGIIVNSPNYTPVATDFFDSSMNTYEFFVRAICSADNKSYWSGPKVYVRNDEPSTAVTIQVNQNSQCNTSANNISFIGATASTTATTCGGINGGDVWFDFVATSKVHIIELSDFTPGNYYISSYEGPWPKIIMSLYEVQPDGSIIEKGCSENNSMVTMYSTELIVGKTYKIRLKLDSTVSNNKKFKICITTPSDVCNIDAFNFDFEKLPMQYVTGISTILNALVIPGWRVNTAAGQMFFQEQNNSMNVTPFSGGQCVQLIQDGTAAWNPSDPNIKGLYKDFDTSEIIKMDYSFASATRSSSTTVQLFAGPPTGPFTLVTEHNATSLVWQLIHGSYTIPSGQNTTRFIFRTKGNNIGHILDAANFKPNTDIITANTTLDCSQSSINVQAIGMGQWIASASNPSVATITNPTNMNTSITGITSPGIYTFIWKTRYCEKSITITRLGVTEIPTVISPITYCASQTATPLTANAPAGYTLLWFTDPITGTGITTAPVPSTNTVGTTNYYVALVDGNGCIGPRTPIEVVVNPIISPVVQFNYDAVSYCKNGSNPILETATGFVSGGTFTATPNGLTINSNTGVINLNTSLVGSYDIVYTLPSSGCRQSGTYTTTINISNEATYNIESSCETNTMLLNVVPTNGFDMTNVNYTWQDSSGNIIGINSNQFNVNEYLTNNSSVNYPFIIVVKVDSEGCIKQGTYLVDTNNCGQIPRGISPNNDGDNDTFDLTGLGVKALTIVNRYGMSVFSFKGNYTNQFKGFTSDGKKLPDGTYFYSISLENGKTQTGWVYINNQY